MRNLRLMPMLTMAMDIVVATMAGMAIEVTMATERGLLWLSLTLMLNLNLMAMATMATTGPMDTGAGERRRGLPSPTMDTADMDMAVGTMGDTVEDIGAKP